MNFKTRLGKRERAIIDYLKNNSRRRYFKAGMLNHDNSWRIADSVLPQSTYFDRGNEKYIKRVLKRLIEKGIVIRIITGAGFKYALFPEISFDIKKVSDRAVEINILRRICYYWENPNRG